MWYHLDLTKEKWCPCASRTNSSDTALKYPEAPYFLQLYKAIPPTTSVRGERIAVPKLCEVGAQVLHWRATNRNLRNATLNRHSCSPVHFEIYKLRNLLFRVYREITLLLLNNVRRAEDASNIGVQGGPLQEGDARIVHTRHHARSTTLTKMPHTPWNDQIWRQGKHTLGRGAYL